MNQSISTDMAGTYAEATGSEECEKHLGSQARLQRKRLQKKKLTRGKSRFLHPTSLPWDGFPAVNESQNHSLCHCLSDSDLHVPHNQPFVVPFQRKGYRLGLSRTQTREKHTTEHT